MSATIHQNHFRATKNRVFLSVRWPCKRKLVSSKKGEKSNLNKNKRKICTYSLNFFPPDISLVFPSCCFQFSLFFNLQSFTGLFWYRVDESGMRWRSLMEIHELFSFINFLVKQTFDGHVGNRFRTRPLIAQLDLVCFKFHQIKHSPGYMPAFVWTCLLARSSVKGLFLLLGFSFFGSPVQ